MAMSMTRSLTLGLSGRSINYRALSQELIDE
jgi:hypothetical protein